MFRHTVFATAIATVCSSPCIAVLAHAFATGVAPSTAITVAAIIVTAWVTVPGAILVWDKSRGESP